MFYADYVVIQYVLIPAYADRSVTEVLIPFKPFKTADMASVSVRRRSIHLANRSDSIPSLLRKRSFYNVFFFTFNHKYQRVCEFKVDICNN